MEDIHNWQSKFESCKYAERLLSKLILLNKQVKQPIDIEEVKKGIYYAKKYHGTQMRQSGEPYYSHPIEVAYMVAEHTALGILKYFRTDMIVTSLLHDTIEDTELTQTMITSIFGDQVASQVEDLTRIKGEHKISSAEIVETLYRQKKSDILVIKIFDRLHNMQTIGSKSSEKRKKIVEETLKRFITLSIYLEDQIDGVLKIEKRITELCYQNLPVKHYLLQNQEMIFKDNYQLFFPTVQNETIHNYIQHILESS
ncbi:MAG TPA: HD domain-containing protein [Rickettsia endosymbiont of Sericostoma sp.]|uniref:HD domain-containing protein n=1 Tax=Candidatus Tisiphia endosymbiont of Mystacides longicornis TaxID=3139330 RepID=UPI001D72FD3C|nr:HD domain-containing protein [Rickettsia endosymbiont of Sericostoma sp.]